MKRIKYTPDAADKLRGIKGAITAKYGSKKANVSGWSSREFESMNELMN